MRSTCACLSLCCLVLVVAGSARAQRGAVAGTVTRSDGTVGAFIDVFLDSSDGGASLEALTDDEGHFEIRNVPVGQYRLYAYEAGMISTKYEGIRVVSGGTARFELLLSEAEVVPDVQIVTGEVTVDTKVTGTKSVLSGDFIRELPLATNSLEGIAALSPKVTRASSESDEISASGGDADQINYTIDGNNANNPVGGGGPAVAVSTYMIEEFAFLTGGWQAKHGERSTGVVLVTTRSGRDIPVAGYQLQWRDSSLASEGLSGIGEVQEFWDRSLSGRGTLLQGELEQGFELLGLGAISTREDDHDPPPRRRLRHGLYSGGPILPGRAHWFVTLESLSDERGSAFTDGSDSREQLLVNTRFDWKLGGNSQLTVTANVDQQGEGGFTDFDSADSTRRSGARGGFQLAGRWTWAAPGGRDVVEARVQYLLRRDHARPADVRSGVGTRYQVPLPPGGVATYFFGDAFADADQTVEVLRTDGSWSRTLGAHDRHETEYGYTLARTGFRSFSEQGADVIDLRVTDDRAFMTRPALAGREVAHGAPRRQDESSLQAALYAQDRWFLTPSLTLEYGLRADWQDFVGEALLAPRFGVSFDALGDGRGRVFGIWGHFHDNVLLAALQHESNPDRLWSDLLFAPGFAQRRFSETPITEIYREALSTPANALSSSDAVATLVPRFLDRFVLDERIRAPKNVAWSVGFEREIVDDTRILLSYSEARRSNQLRQTSRTVRFPQQAGERTIRELVLGSSGSGRYRDWTLEIQRRLGPSWQVNASYVQSRNTGPIAAEANPLDPSDVISENGLQPGDRTHLVKLQSSGRLPGKVGFSADFTWQTGTPVSATLVRSDGTTERPFGRNTLRLPSSRQLNAGFRKSFATADGRLRVGADLQVFNILGERNVVGGRGRFAVPDGAADPEAFAPLRPLVVATDLDVPRSLQLGLSIDF